MKTTVLLFSPGLDSFLGNWLVSKNLEKDEELIRMYIDIKSRYSKFEIEFLMKWYGNQITFISGPDMSSLETKTAFVPNRNAILSSLAQAYTSADRVLLNATMNDRVADGSVQFRNVMSDVLHISNEKPVLVDSPLFRNEKSFWVKQFAEEHPDKKLDLLNKTFSCYNADLYEEEDLPYFKHDGKEFIEVGKTTVFGCMECSACYRRFCALTAANLYVPFYDFNLIEEYMKKNIDAETYPKRVETMKNYLEFMKWFGCGD